MKQSHQVALKPQDLVVVLKLVARGSSATYANLGAELALAPSAVHAAVTRAVAARLLSKVAANIAPVPQAIREFVLFGARYAFPLSGGGVTQGMPTGTAAPPLDRQFATEGAIPSVWPFEKGTMRGLALVPLYPGVPHACSVDLKLYQILAAFDALRGGAAREREAATSALKDLLT